MTAETAGPAVIPVDDPSSEDPSDDAVSSNEAQSPRVFAPLECDISYINDDPLSLHAASSDAPGPGSSTASDVDLAGGEASENMEEDSDDSLLTDFTPQVLPHTWTIHDEDSDSSSDSAEDDSEDEIGKEVVSFDWEKFKKELEEVSALDRLGEEYDREVTSIGK